MQSDIKICPNCKSSNHYYNEIMDMNICGYCFLGFDRKNKNTNSHDIDQFKNSIKKHIEEVDVLFGEKTIESKIQIEYKDLSNTKLINNLIYPFVDKNGPIKSLYISDISSCLLDDIMKYSKVFDPDAEIWILSPTIKYSYSEYSSRFVYSIYSIYKTISLYNMDIFDMFNIDSKFNLLKIKFGILEDANLQEKFQTYSDHELHSKLFNPKLTI